MPMSNGMRLDAITPCCPHVAPPSNERLKAMVLAEKSFQATYTSPPGPTKGTAPMPRPGPLGSSARVVVKVAPASEDRATRMPPLMEPPEAASHAMYTRSRNGLPTFVSAVIIGLSLKWFVPPSSEKRVTEGYVRPPSVDRATAMAVPLM